MASPHVFEVTAQGFEQEVVDASATTPVLLDFWAEWCGPCKTLTPILEKIADDYGGAFRLGKVNTEVETELAYAFRVQNIPFCALFVGGKAVDAFAGAVDEPEIRKFLKRFQIEPLGGTEDGDPDSPERRFADGRVLAMRGEVGAARERLQQFPEEHELHTRVQHLLDGLELIDTDPGTDSPAAAGLIAAREHFAAGHYPGAVEALLESVAADRGYRNSLARRGIVLCFELMDGGADEESVIDYRRQLATLLF